MKAHTLEQRKRLRIGNYDYSNKGSYFITVCTHDNHMLLGAIQDDKLIKNDIGKFIQSRWEKIPERYPGVSLGSYVVMPNHFHGILILSGEREATEGLIGREATEGLPYGPSLQMRNGDGAKAVPSLPQIMHWYKTWTTNEYFRYMKIHSTGNCYLKLWHRSYYDHIIRSNADFLRISEYIQNNPANWEKDRFAWPENR